MSIHISKYKFFFKIKIKKKKIVIFHTLNFFIKLNEAPCDKIVN